MEADRISQPLEISKNGLRIFDQVSRKLIFKICYIYLKSAILRNILHKRKKVMTSKILTTNQFEIKIYF